MNEHVEKDFTERFQSGIRRFSEVCGEPSVCVMGYVDFGRFEELCKKHCTIVMKEEEPEFGKRQWLGIDIFEGDIAVGMTFGK